MRMRIQDGGKLFAWPESDPEYRGLIAIGTQRKGNNEKNALDHSLGSSGPVRVGTGLGDHHNDDHH